MDKKYILITGGDLYNKGAQSMLFVTIDELSSRFPNHKIVVLSSRDYKRSAEELSQFTYLVLRFTIYIESLQTWVWPLEAA
jgi:colanic acid/amylovoran biosynthesis protein